MIWINDIKKEIEWSIKNNKKGLAAQMGMLFINISFIAYNSYQLYINSSIGHAVGLGAFISNTFWTMGFCMSYWIEMRDSKRELQFLDGLELKDKLSETIKFYEDAKNNYEEKLSILCKREE